MFRNKNTLILKAIIISAVATIGVALMPTDGASAYSYGSTGYSKCISSASGVSAAAAAKICSHYGNGTARYGAQWINADSGITSGNDVTVTGSGGTATVYMHRKVYNDSSGNNGNLCVNNIRIYSSGLSGYHPQGVYPSGSQVSFLTGFGGTLCGGSSYSNGWSGGGTLSGTLDVDKLKQEYPDCEQNGECDITVYIYRCSTSGTATKPCGTDITTFHVKLNGTPPVTPPTTATTCDKLISDLGGYSAATDIWGKTQALSGVIKNTGTKWEHTVYVKPYDYVKFAHCYFPDAHKIKVSGKFRGDNHPTHRYGYEDCSHCECETCHDEDGSTYTCYYNCEYDWHADTPSRPYYLANDGYFQLRASPESYKFKPQVTKQNSSFTYNVDAGYAYKAFGYKSTSWRDTKAVALVSPELNSQDYRCGTSPLGTYTIVGTDPRNCTGGINGGVWDPGTTFEQYIYFRGTIETQAIKYTDDCPFGSTSPAHAGQIHSGGYYVEDYTRDGTGESQQRAKVVVPYNFETSIEVDMVTSNVIYPGATITSEVSGMILPKSNADVGGSYATITPGSTVEVVQFTLPASWGVPGGMDGDNNYGGNPASYVRNVIGGQDIQSYTMASGANFNPRSSTSYDITNMLHNGGSVNSVVPDVDTGTKLCTVAGIWPSDSHGIPDQGVASGGNGIGSGPGQNVFGNWRISGVTCRTIAKKPTFQVWSGGIYTGNSIQTSITDKCLRSGVMIEQDCSRTVYGSWSEYEAIAIGAITNFASASGYGFSSTPDAHGNYGRDGGLAKALYNDSYNYSHATISNSASSFKGLSNISVDDAFLARIMSRYSATTSGYDSCNIGGLAEWQVRNAPGHVIVFRCNGTATISGNIITGHDRYYKIDDLPQVIIIANNINISSNVTEVDAWLIATNSTNYANGTINTCSQFHTGSTAASSNKWTAGNTDCSLQLTINGPIITGRIYLNRTYGAYPGDNSIEPAEIFNLRADAYLWAYSQSEDYHQAVTTYTRELAPRY